METWHVDTGQARADFGATLQGRTASVVSHAKFAAFVDPSPQTSGPEAVDVPRYKGGGDGDFIGVCEGTALIAVGDALHARKLQSDAAYSSARTCGPIEASLRPAPSGRHPWPTLHMGARTGFSRNPQFHTTFLDEAGTAEWRSWQQDAIVWCGTSRYAYSFSDHRVRRRRHEQRGMVSTILLLFSLL